MSKKGVLKTLDNVEKQRKIEMCEEEEEKNKMDRKKLV